MACISPSGRRTRSGYPWSAISTPGTAAAIRCASGSTSGLWEIFAPGIARRGGLQVRNRRPGRRALLPLKADPFGFAAELRPSTARSSRGPMRFAWTDAACMSRAATRRSATAANVDL